MSTAPIFEPTSIPGDVWVVAEVGKSCSAPVVRARAHNPCRRSTSGDPCGGREDVDASGDALYDSLSDRTESFSSPPRRIQPGPSRASMSRISRREFGALIAAGMVTGRFAPIAFGQDPVARASAAEIVDRIRRNIGVPWNETTVDTIKAGDPSTVVTGIATTAMATMAVLRQAAADGANMVVTAEPTFYARLDGRTPPAAGGPAAAASGATPPPDPVYTAKNELIEANGLVVFRLFDHWRARRPDPFASGLADAILGAGIYQANDDPPSYDIPSVSLNSLASDIKRRLGARGGIRVVGDPGIRVRRVGLLPGSTPIAASLETLPKVDVIVAGEVREWESVEYVRDVVFSGRAKGMILIGRVVSEDPGMALCARWLESIVPEVAVRHITAGDPYWRPEA
jgi:hypothetical protein